MEEVKANREIGEREYKLAVDGRKKSSTGRTVSSQNQSTSRSTVAKAMRRIKCPAPPRRLSEPQYESKAMPVSELAYHAGMNPIQRRSRASRNRTNSSSSVPTVPVAPGASDRSSRGNNSRRDSSSSGKGSTYMFGGVFEFKDC